MQALKKLLGALIKEWTKLKWSVTKRMQLIDEQARLVPDNKLPRLREAVGKLNEKYKELGEMKKRFQILDL